MLIPNSLHLNEIKLMQQNQTAGIKDRLFEEKSRLSM